LNERGHLLVSLIFCLPFLLPIPVPGLSILFGLVISASAFGVIIGKPPWLPASWKKKVISKPMLEKLTKHGIKTAEYIEKVFRPRGKSFLKYWWVEKASAVAILLCGLLLALPLPPGTNFPPAFAIILLSLASIEKDTVALALGLLMFVLNIVLFCMLGFWGAEGIKSLFGA